MSHNWEFALSHVTDGWVAFIGDDDGLLPEAIESVASIISSASAMAIRSTFCTYEWPETAGNRNGRLVVPLGQGLSIRELRKLDVESNERLGEIYPATHDL